MPSKVPYGCRRGWIVASRVRALRFGCTLIRMLAMLRERTVQVPPLQAAAGAVVMLCVGACSGGGGGGGGGSTGSMGGGTSWTPGVYMPESHFAAQCAAPRSGSDPVTGQPYPDVAGTAVDENNWLRSWTNDLYLWYSEAPDLNPANYTTAAYFPLLKSSATDAQGQPKDKFHFTYPTSTWEALSLQGQNVGYGAQLIVMQPTPPRRIVVAYTDPGSPAAMAPESLARGASVLAIDGVDAVNANTQAEVDVLNAGLFPSSVESHAFSILDQGAASPRMVTLQAVNVTDVPVQDVMVLSGTVTNIGYMLFNDQLATSEAALISAVNTLKANPTPITDLVIDIRYNGGGFLDIASELAYMIAGPGPTAGQTFELQQFNGKHPSTNPVTGTPITPTLFHTTTQGFSTTAGQALPTLDLPRVFVLTTSATCSASEAVMNGLAGVGVQVIQIGSTTCGKPYGFYPQDNCGTTYFSIEFSGVNANGFGDYPDGFTPGGASGATFPGCTVTDDFTHALGDPNESLLYVATHYAQASTCAIPPAGIAPPAPSASIAIRSPLREMRLLRRDAASR
ncbi:MAG: peptidase [Gammaproteobacteria bacterium]|nr:MAG: peptidase [Gammaproteobacteria bacterium]